MQCGIACLQMVCKYFGREYTSDSLSNLCFATTEGVSMLGINETANNLGLRTICVKTTTSIFEGNDNASYNCNIISHNAKLIHREDGNYFMATATVSTQGQNTPILQQYMKADVRIIVSNKTVFQR